jgi:hypothetical protein
MKGPISDIEAEEARAVSISRKHSEIPHKVSHDVNVREGGKFRGARNIAGRSSNAAGHADCTRRIAASVDCALFFVAMPGLIDGSVRDHQRALARQTNHRAVMGERSGAISSRRHLRRRNDIAGF